MFVFPCDVCVVRHSLFTLPFSGIGRLCSANCGSSLTSSSLLSTCIYHLYIVASCFFFLFYLPSILRQTYHSRLFHFQQFSWTSGLSVSENRYIPAVTDRRYGLFFCLLCVSYCLVNLFSQTDQNSYL